MTDLPTPDAIPPVRDGEGMESDTEPPQTIRADCPDTRQSAVMDDPEVRAITAPTGAYGKYVGYFYRCPCGARHEFNYGETDR